MRCLILLLCVAALVGCGRSPAATATRVAYVHPYKWESGYDRFKLHTTQHITIGPLASTFNPTKSATESWMRLGSRFDGQTRSVKGDRGFFCFVEAGSTSDSPVDWLVDGVRIAWPREGVELQIASTGVRYFEVPAADLEQIAKASRVEWRHGNTEGVLSVEAQQGFLDFLQSLEP